MANLLKKVEINPLKNIGRSWLCKKHDQATTDEEIADFYHYALNTNDKSPVAIAIIYMMIAYSTDMDINPLYIHAIDTINSNSTTNGKS